MKIESLNITGFGALSGEYEFTPGLNIILGDNEAGKSTLSSAIMALLYGTHQIRGQKRLAHEDHKHFRPFSSNSYALSGVIDIGKKRLNVWRDFGKDIFRIVDLAAGKDISSEYSRSPNGDILGQVLFGLSRTEFEKLCFIRQEDLTRVWDFSEFSDSLSALFSSEDGQGQTIESAITALNQALLKYPGLTGSSRIKIETEIKRIETRLAEIDSELRQLEEDCAGTEQSFANIADKVARNNSLVHEVAQYEYLATRARHSELKDVVGKREQARLLIHTLNEKIAKLEELDALDLSQISRLTELLTIKRDRVNKLSGYEKEISVASARLDILKSRLEAVGSIAQLPDDILREIEFSSQNISDIQRRESSAAIDAQSAASALKSGGHDPEKVGKALAWFNSLSDDDKEFLSGYEQQQSTIELELAKLNSKRKEIESAKDNIIHFRKDTAKSARTHVLLSLLLFVISIGAFLLLGMLWFMLLPPILCLGWGAFGFYKVFTAASLEADSLDKINGDLTILFAAEDELDRKRREVSTEFDGLSSGFMTSTNEDDLSKFLPLFSKNIPAISNWLNTRTRLSELSDKRHEIIGAVRSKLSSCSDINVPDSLDLRWLDQFARDLKDALIVQKQFRQTEDELARISACSSELQRELSLVKDELKSIAAAAAIAEDISDEGLLEQYKIRSDNKAELMRLRSADLPQAINNAGDETSLNALKADMVALEKRSEMMLGKYPEFAGLEPDKAVSDYEFLCNCTRQHMTDDSDALSHLEREMALEMNRFREVAPGLYIEKEELEQGLRKAQAFDKAIVIAASKMEGIASELHARWSPFLSQELNELVRRFSDRWTLDISRDLRLTVCAAASGNLIDEDSIGMYLSSGMREQVYLSLRSILACKLGNDQPYPLIMDDPFVNADDKRFLEGMDYILKLSENNQVFVFSCHNSRHQELIKNDPRFSGAILDFFYK